jgi:dipeptidyl aminopeptidase/acylaminoacyl peptidase
MMRNGSLLRSTILAGAVLLTAGLTNAQDATRQPGQKAPSKPHKVWTEDDLGSIRRRGDVTVAAAQNATIPASAEAAPAPTPAATSSSTAQATGKKALSNPKTAEEADSMIAWEQRDINSQQEYVDRVQEQLDQAPADQKEHFQKLLAERQQILADVRREQQQLIAQKKQLQKKSGDSSVAASTQP